ncbi:MAG: NAD(P)-dependent oxidoreductase, partial [Marinomonas foliarum]|uniref:NAD(P)-dependent oxidoreductase n=1 Tax=Marinomonas foliarum TaxID=491950 RepID=UPI003F95622F
GQIGIVSYWGLNRSFPSSVIDVFINEPLDRKDPVWDLNNTILTPHVAGRIDDETAANNVASNIENFMNGNDLKWLIDRSKGY